MTNYSKLQQLLAELCPEGVEFKKLGDLEYENIIKLWRGNVISKSDLAKDPGEYPVYSSSATENGEFGRYWKYMFNTEMITWSIDGGGRFFYRPAHKYSVTNVAGWIRVDNIAMLNIKYLYYVLSNAWTKKTFDYIKKAHPSVIKDEYIIPIPPLPVQEEIVRILDKFTSLEAELEAELEARKSQYEYYRDKLLAFNEEKVERKSLGEVVSLKRWVRVTKNQLEENGLFPVYQNSLTPLWFFNQFNYQKNKTFVISAWAAWSVGYSKDDFRAADDCFVMEWPNTINDKYLYYFLKNQENYLFSKVRRASIPRLWREFIEKIPIPIPPLEQQEAIVYVLDNFDKLANDLTEWLPAELELRQQQYEYYRDLLLDFTDKNWDLRERERESHKNYWQDT